MNWYKKISMPLPQVGNAPYDYDDKWRVQRLNEMIPDETKDPEGTLDYLGSGAFGVAYSPQENQSMAVKYTTDSTEADAAEIIMNLQKEKGGFLPHVVGVYGHEKLPNSDVYRITTEKINMLPKEIRDYIDAMRDSVYNKGKMNKEEFIKRFKKEMDVYYTSNEYELDKIMPIINKYYALVTYLIKIGLKPNDAHSENVGIRRSNGKYVLFDLGLSVST